MLKRDFNVHASLPMNEFRGFPLYSVIKMKHRANKQPLIAIN
jgi:hypothetical protein